METVDRALRFWFELIEADAELARHHRRVTQYAKEIAAVVCPEKVDVVILAASLHDLGKIGLPGEIFAQPRTLTDGEWELVRLHPVIGAELLKRCAGAGISAETIAAVRHHHEHWDGGGYPAGLKGKEIPLISRILAIADAFDAVTFFRPYRTSLSLEEALQEIRQQAGAQFDPEMAEVFMQIVSGGLRTTSGEEVNREEAEDVLDRVAAWAAAGETEKLFTLLVETHDPAAREAAWLELVRQGTPEVMERFISLLASPEAHLRGLAVEALQELGVGFLDRLETLLYDADPDIRIHVLSILAGVKSETAAEPVRRFLARVSAGEKVPENVLAAALECLVALGGPGDADLLGRVEALLHREGVHPYLVYACKQAQEKLWAV